VESERHGFELSLIAELNLNDIKGHRAPSLDCWTLAPAVAAVTQKLELMLAVRPNYHSPSLTAKSLSTLDTIAPGRVSLNVVSSWWKDEAPQREEMARFGEQVISRYQGEPREPRTAAPLGGLTCWRRPSGRARRAAGWPGA
jgi:alkanesulfonate monooxygenase SsuD/methylene tetrahydromethanopterin reductase-like flavin-dependent oxidoreductase (luciferase family)